jgi:hypothetical protein
VTDGHPLCCRAHDSSFDYKKQPPQRIASVRTTNPEEIAMKVQPYLMFDGRCEEASEYYRRALGAEVEMLMRFKDCPDPEGCPPGEGEKVMHMALRIGDSTVMASGPRRRVRRLRLEPDAPLSGLGHGVAAA